MFFADAEILCDPAVASAFLACGDAGSPDFTRSLKRPRSNWAMPASIVAIMRPCGVSSSKVMPFMASTDNSTLILVASPTTSSP